MTKIRNDIKCRRKSNLNYIVINNRFAHFIINHLIINHIVNMKEIVNKERISDWKFNVNVQKSFRSVYIIFLQRGY